MVIERKAAAGTAEKQDAAVTVWPEEGVMVTVESAPHERFRGQICDIMRDELRQMDVRDIHVAVEDHGALEFVLRARLRAAVMLAGEV